MTFYLLHLKNYPIYQQLQLEEALLRCDNRNFCILNEGASPAIVMGISGQVKQLVDPQKQAQQPLPIIQRFSGGGTVVVDEDTLFVSLICQKKETPEQLLRFGESIYQKAWEIPQFHLKENDYVIGERKCAGNAQYLRKERSLQHTTFLWDYKEEKMDYLLYPAKTPQYRKGRAHTDFMCRLSDYLPSKDHFFERLKAELASRFTLVELSLEDLFSVAQLPHRKSTVILAADTCVQN